ncbi:hypothetical protein [Desulfobacter vibrioformis]|uniref:hypothetical protein n=1 Tax=Desulfobacter vibrioformis TaxID=34031 RepID=UPI000550793E|nr:hypothetical protein [Desulfobacter vibrioformis]
MKFFKKRKIKKIRAEIVNDDQLLPEQRETALARLDQKEMELFQPNNIASQSQSIFQTLLPTIVGKVQLKRLRTRNEMIREMRITLNELAETKKSWERLKNIDAEIAVEQALAYQAHQEEVAAHQKKMAQLQSEKKEIEQKSEEADLRHSVNKLKLEMELEALKNKQAAGEPKEKTLDEKLREIKDRLTLDKAEVKGARELRQIKREFEQDREQKGNEAVKLEMYERLRSRISELKKQGAEDETIRQVYELLDQEFEFNRDVDD